MASFKYYDGSSWVELLPTSGGDLTGHLYLTGATTSSTSNTTQIVFGTANSQSVAISSNPGGLIINPSTSSTNGQINLWVGSNPRIEIGGSRVALASEIPSIPSSLPANGGNSDTVDNLHASDFLRTFYNHELGANDFDNRNYFMSGGDTGGNWAGTTYPSSAHNGMAILNAHTHPGNYYTQLCLSTSSNDLFIRSANNESSFGSWYRLAKDGEAQPASDVYSWAKQSTKPSYDFSEINPGNIVIGDGSGTYWYRTGSSLHAGFYYQTNGDESVVFANQYSAAGWMFVNGIDVNDRPSWQNLTPTLQIKSGGVAIGKLIGQGQSPAYNLDVNGTANATTIYENGTALSSKYLGLSGGTLYNSSSDTALNLKSNASNSYLGFYNSSGTALGWLGVNSSNQPIFNVSGSDYRIALYNEIPTVPTNVSSFTNDAGYITSASIPSSLPANGGTANFLNYTNRQADGSGVAQFCQYDGSTNNPTTDWYSHILMNHENSAGYFTEIAACFHSDNVYFRRKAAGTVYNWKRFAFDDEIPTNTNQLTNGAGYITSSGSCASATSAGSATVADNVTKLTTAPDSANTSGRVAFVFLPSSQESSTTKYDGYVYIFY